MKQQFLFLANLRQFFSFHHHHITKMKPVLAIDIDDTLGPLIPSIAEFHNHKYGTSFKIEDFISYQFVDVWGGTKEDTILKVSAFFESSYITKFYPFQGAYETLSRLKLDFDLHVVTARQNSVEDLTRKWINTFFPGIFTDIHFGNHFSPGDSITRSKSEICQSINAKLLVDDNVGHAVDCVTKANMHAIVFGQYGWNRDEILLQTSSDKSVLSRISRMLTWESVEKEVYRIFSDKSFSDSQNNSFIFPNSKQSLRVACIQMCSSSDKVANLLTTTRLVEQAVADEAKFVCLPECSAFMGSSATAVLEASEPLSGPYLAALGQLAGRLNIWLSVGGFPESVLSTGSEDATVTRVYNTHVMISPSGNICEPVYRKMHLFDCPLVGLRESATTAPGDSVHVIDSGFANIGLSICYDLRFPELYASLSGSREEAEQTSVDTDTATVTAVTTKVEKAIIRSSSDSNIHASKQVRNLDMAHDYSTSAGADIILVPSAFTVPTGTAHWLTLLRARAIENQVYVVAAAQYGRHNERRESYGHSVIINPWGDIVSECTAMNSQSVKPSVGSIVYESDSAANATENNVQLIKHRVTEEGEICYGIYDPAFLKGIREKMPIQAHKRFRVALKKFE